MRLPDWTPYPSPSEVTIPEALKPAGYISASIGKWHLGGQDSQYPRRQNRRVPDRTMHTPIEAKPEMAARYRGRVRPGQAHRHPECAAMIENFR